MHKLNHTRQFNGRLIVGLNLSAIGLILTPSIATSLKDYARNKPYDLVQNMIRAADTNNDQIIDPEEKSNVYRELGLPKTRYLEDLPARDIRRYLANH